MNLKLLFKSLLVLILYVSAPSVFGQHAMQIEASFDIDTNTVTINQRVDYQNNSNESLNELYFNDWTSSYSSPTTPLANRFVEEFKNDLLSVKPKDRGYTKINKIKNSNGTLVEYSYLENQPDILKVKLETTLLPNTTTTLHFEYTLQIQSNRFTGFGVTPDGGYNLNYWYLSPAVYENSQNLLVTNTLLLDLFSNVVLSRA